MSEFVDMEEWKEYRLGDVMQFNPKEKIAKGKVSRKIAMDQLVPFCRDVDSQIYEEYKGGAKFRNGDTIMARITPCLENGKTSYISSLEDDEVAFGSTEYIVLRNIEGVSDSRFVYYLSICPEIRGVAIKSMVGSSGRQRVQQDVLENYCIYLPSLPTQQKIANILSSLDDKIEVNRRINEQLEELAQALFKSWFVDFEPFKDGEFVESELGMIPKGWKVVSFKEFITPSQEKVFVGDLPEYSVTNNGIVPRDEKFKKQLSKATSKNKVLKKDNLVFGMSREILNWGIMEDLIGSVSSAYNVYIIDDEQICPTFLRLYMSANISIFNDLIGNAAREGQSLDKAALMNKKVYLPNGDVWNDFMLKYSAIKENIAHNQQEILHLTTLRDTLLPKLMSGEIDVNERGIERTYEDLRG